jgi:hypothetical protein
MPGEGGIGPQDWTTAIDGGLASISQGCDRQARISCQPIRRDSLTGRTGGGGTETKATLETRPNRQADNATSKDATGPGGRENAVSNHSRSRCRLQPSGTWCMRGLGVAVPDREEEASAGCTRHRKHSQRCCLLTWTAQAHGRGTSIASLGAICCGVMPGCHGVGKRQASAGESRQWQTP